jgi:magnesium chelatase family protein
MANRVGSVGPAHIRSAAVHGIDALPVDIEVDVLKGLPSFTVVGLTDKAIQESRERLTAALSNLGYEAPRRKTIVSLAPASLKKEGSLYDVPIALGFLCASNQVQISPQRLDWLWCVGELGLDGTIRPIRGLLPIVLAAVRNRVRELIIPAANATEAVPLADKVAIYAVKSLQDLLLHLQSGQSSRATTVPQLLKPETRSSAPPVAEIDMSEIRGQDHAKRALAICAAGGHNALLVGPPGTGKTLLARRWLASCRRCKRKKP